MTSHVAQITNTEQLKQTTRIIIIIIIIMFYTNIGSRNLCISTLHCHQFNVDPHEYIQSRAFAINFYYDRTYSVTSSGLDLL